ncbi:SMI1/KNR4 family protein [Streptomyces triculaminicus]|uniref:SMI1/KNR4 family protein n=1 Tax=Streptomyces triculaminicus TaxID=2816232 RepID=UPI00340F94B5
MNARIWAGVRERVRALPYGDSLAEPLTAEELGELEAQIGVALPDEYRGFLRHVGAGGAGIFLVRRVDGSWLWEGDGAALTELSRLAEPFPRTGPHAERLAALVEAWPEESDHADGEAYEAAYDAWAEEWEPLLWSADRTPGAVVIAHLGCALREWLIVSGPERGRIWSDDRADGVDLAPLLDDKGEPATFARWYLDWLEQAEHEASLRGDDA